MSKFKTLLELDGWSFMSEPGGMVMKPGVEYIFIAHITCPLGVELEVVSGSQKAPSVMHYDTHICQRCKKSPPDGLFATYRLYEWGSDAVL